LKEQWNRTLYTKFPYNLDFVDDIEEFFSDQEATPEQPKASPITPEKEEVAKVVTLAPLVNDVKVVEVVEADDVKQAPKKQVKLLLPKPKVEEVADADSENLISPEVIPEQTPLLQKAPEKPRIIPEQPRTIAEQPTKKTWEDKLNSIFHYEAEKPKYFDSMGIPCSKEEYEEEQELLKMRRDTLREIKEREREEEERKFELRRMWEIERKVQNEQDEFRQRRNRLEEIEDRKLYPITRSDPPPITTSHCPTSSKRPKDEIGPGVCVYGKPARI
jgi:hypothetical protein